MTQFKSRRSINFDLDTNQMKYLGKYPNRYKEIERFFRKKGFIHRQGSGYVSKRVLSSMSVLNMIRQLRKQSPWLIACTKDIIMTDFTKQSNITKIITEKQEQQKSSSSNSKLKKMLKGDNVINSSQSHTNKDIVTHKKPSTNTAKKITIKSIKGGGAAL